MGPSPLTPGAGQAWRGALARRRCRQLRAACTIVAWYKRYKVRTYLRELLRRFQAVRSLPDFGKSLAWPEPPATLERFQAASQHLFCRYQPLVPRRGTGDVGWGQGLGMRTWMCDGDRHVGWRRGSGEVGGGTGTWDGYGVRDRDVGQGWGQRFKYGTWMWERDVGWGHGTGMLDRDVGWRCGTGMGWGCGMWMRMWDRDAGQGCEMEMWNGDMECR